MVAVGEGYCRKTGLAKIFSSALCSVSRVEDCNCRAGVVWMIVVCYYTYRLTYFHRRRGVCVGDGRECVGSAMLKSKNQLSMFEKRWLSGRPACAAAIHRPVTDLAAGRWLPPLSASRALALLHSI